MSRQIPIAMILLAVALASSCRRVHEAVPVHPVPDQVPAQFKEVYRELDAEFHRQLPLIPVPWGQKPGPTVFGAELPAVERHRGEARPDGSALEAAALVLDRLKPLGVRCVVLSLPYPVLTRAYGRTPEFRAFYRGLAAEIRRRGLAIVVELGSASRGPEPSRSGADLRGPDRDRFDRGLREMAEAVIADIRPDWLTLLAEPDAQTRNTGLPFSPAEFAATVKHVARDLERPGIRIGAGAGTWTALEYFKALAEIPELDYLDLRIAPIQHGFAAERAVKAAAVARSAGKAVGIGEAWLLKAWGRELNRVSAAEAFSRNVFAFWQPLDAHFIELVANLARSIEAEFCSFSGTNFLFGYLDYTPDTGRLAPGELMELSDQAAWGNIRAGVISATGAKLKETLKP